MRFFHLLGALLLVTATVPSAHAVDQEATFTVTVVDQSGEHVSGVDVTAKWSGENTTATTNSRGQVELTAPAGVRVTIEIRDGTLVQNIPTVVTATEGGETTIQVAREGVATVSVTSADGEAIADAAVALSRDNTTIVRGNTDERGVFDTGPLQRGEYQLGVTKAGYYTRSETVTVNASSTREVTLDSGTTTLRVRVVDDHYDDSRPLTGATVALESAGEFTSYSGRVQTIDVPVNADLDVEVSKDGYETASRTVAVGTTERRVTVAIQRTPALTLNATRTTIPVDRPIEVRLTNEYGTAVEGGTVSVGETVLGETNAQGVLEVSLPETGLYNVTAEHAGVVSAPLVLESTTTPSTTVTETAQSTRTEAPSTTTESSGSGPGFTAPLTVLIIVGVLVLRRE